MTTTVVNMRTYGREGVTAIDRSTIFGNPFAISGTTSREESIKLYHQWFEYNIANDQEFRKAVEQLRGKTLGCWCKPKACHGDVIVEWLEGNNT